MHNPLPYIPYKDIMHENSLNVSEVCREALEAKVVMYERIQEALSKEDIMEGLIARLKIEKAEASEWSYNEGKDNGENWVIENASYQELVQWGDVPLYENYINGMPFPDTAEASEWYRNAEELASNFDELFDHDAYATGFLKAVHEIWVRVQHQL